MKIIYNSIIPFKKFMAINLFGVLFVRNDLERPIGALTINHEAIHSEQYKELYWIGFLPLYLIEWFVKLLIYGNSRKAYRNISFEREAYKFQNDLNYIEKRKKFSLLHWKTYKNYYIIALYNNLT